MKFGGEGGIHSEAFKDRMNPASIPATYIDQLSWGSL